MSVAKAEQTANPVAEHWLAERYVSYDQGASAARNYFHKIYEPIFLRSRRACLGERICRKLMAWLYKPLTYLARAEEWFVARSYNRWRAQAPQITRAEFDKLDPAARMEVAIGKNCKNIVD